MFESGASAKPTLKLQRPRDLISLRKRLTLAATASGTPPASTASKWRAARSSSPLRKKARASSSRTRTKSGTLDQHDVEGGDGLVEQHLPLLVGAAGPLRCLQRRQAVEEERVRFDRLLLEQRPQRDDRLLEAAGVDQRPGLGCGGRWRGLGGGERLTPFVRAGRRRGNRRLLGLRLRVLGSRRQGEG